MEAIVPGHGRVGVVRALVSPREAAVRRLTEALARLVTWASKHLARARVRNWRFAGPMPRPGRDLQRLSRGHHRGRESNGCLWSGRGRHGRGWRRRDRDSAFRARGSSREAFDRSALPMHCAQNCDDVAGWRIGGEPAVFVANPLPSFRDAQAVHSPLFGQSGAISRETASMTASLLVVRSGAVVALNSGFSVAQALAIDWTRTRIAVASHRSVNLPSL